MTFVDSNYFLRFFLADIADQYQKSKKFFKKVARGEEEAVTSELVVFEVFWVLRSLYKFDKERLLETMRLLLSLPGIKIENRGLLRKALFIYETTSLEFPDCYNTAYGVDRGCSELKTFDKKLAREFKRFNLQRDYYSGKLISLTSPVDLS